MRVKKLPMILALHLKRFKYMDQLHRYTKLSYRVVFPLELRLFNTSGDATNPERMYDLVAVVVHCGRCVVGTIMFKSLLHTPKKNLQKSGMWFSLSSEHLSLRKNK